MRTSIITVVGILASSFLTGCTVKDVEPPSLAGPSTLARAITMTANKDTLFQNGVDFVDILVTSTSPTGQPQNIPLRAEILVGGVVQDFGTLNTKTPTTPTTLRYTAPNASPLPAGQVAQVVTIAVTPVDSGDFRSEVARQIDLRLVPQGVILPTNPNLTAAFTVTPASPQAFSTASFDASTTTNGGTACLSACSYAWNFGDGTSGSGITTTHDFRAVGVYQVTLTVSDSRGAQATTVRTVTVTASTPPDAQFTFSPTSVGLNQDVFFDASQSRATLPRRIVSYGWNFGDGTSGSGVTTTRRYSSPGTFQVTLTVTDDVGSSAQRVQGVTVSTGNPVATMTFLPSAPRVGQSVAFNGSASTSATSTIVSYRFSYGDGSTADSGSPSTQTHVFSSAGTYVVTLTVTDAIGRTGTFQVSVPVVP